MNIRKLSTPRLVYGVGINDVDYAVEKKETIGYVGGKQKQKLIWACPYHRAWKNMLKRCYSDKFQDKNPTYKGCTVADDWLTFSVFKNWMEAQNWEGKQLDKDLLFEGNKVYSAETCAFVTRAVNMFTIDSGASRGERLIGVYWHKAAGKFKSTCSNPFTNKPDHLGLFDSEQEAHEAWRKRKLELAHDLAAIQTDPRVAKALVDRYSQYCV